MAPTRDRNLRCAPPPRGSSPAVWPPPQGVESYDVAPPAGSNSTVWPLPQNRILQCGPPRVIGDQGSDFPLWPLRWIRLSAVAPPGGSDFPLWPLPGDWISAIASPGGSDFPLWPLPRGSRATSQDRSNSLPERVVAFKGTTCEKCFYGGTILPKDYDIHACDLLYCSLKKKVNPPRGATPWDRLRIRISRRIRIYIRKGFCVGFRGLGEVFC